MSYEDTVDVEIVLDRLATLPSYANENDAGLDISAALESAVIIYPNERKLIPGGLAVKIPKGYHMQIQSRSGLTITHGIVVAQGTGIIDSGYRGMVKIILHNISDEPYTINPGAKIAQGLLIKVAKANLIVVPKLDESSRGEGGFGSTGGF